jgi:hypothetical protein
METTKINEPVERRKNKRFPFQGDALVYLSTKPPIAGLIVDISEGGLAFTYLASDRCTRDLLSLDILCTQRDLGSLTIFARTIWDLEMVKTTIDGARGCGVRFKRLTVDQKRDIKKFIACCTPSTG